MDEMSKYRFFNDSLALDIYALFKPNFVKALDEQCADYEEFEKSESILLQGIIYLIIGTSFVILYLLCLVAMAQQKFMKIICYRILFVIGIVDIFSMTPNSLLPGYLLINGYSFCESPLLNLYIGSGCFPLWSTYSALSIVLALNRCVDFISTKYQDELFGGKRLIFWMIPPFIYGTTIYFTYPPLVFHTPTASYYFAAVPDFSETPIIFFVNNISLQCFGICTTVLITGLFYVGMQFIELPQFMYTVTNLSWQFSNGSMAIFYMAINKSMRREIYASFKANFVEALDEECVGTVDNTKKIVFQGVFYLFLGTSFVILYLLCLVAMAQQKFMKIICYRILFVIGIVDIISMTPNSLLPGYLLINGYSFCESPLLNLYIGSGCFPLWSTYSALSIVLAINRCVDFLGPKFQEELFGGKRLIFWMIPPFIYGITIYFTYPPLVFHTPTASYYFAAEPQNSKTPIIFFINNVGVAISIFILNLFMLFFMWRMNRKMNTYANNLQKIISLQCFGICTTVLITGVFYVGMQFIELPQFMYTVTNLSWQFSNGSMAIFYMAINKSMRHEVIRLVCGHPRRSTVQITLTSKET
ncbi:unnamed protein product, partial [Mesorhabditis belari]|uniref:Uncharacterized protein n=1 Tax=Mesorhabditis belari TaxID=2138241 RepID=A0AAF3F918_9BILA